MHGHAVAAHCTSGPESRLQSPGDAASRCQDSRPRCARRHIGSGFRRASGVHRAKPADRRTRGQVIAKQRTSVTDSAPTVFARCSRRPGPYETRGAWQVAPGCASNGRLIFIARSRVAEAPPSLPWNAWPRGRVRPWLRRLDSLDHGAWAETGQHHMIELAQLFSVSAARICGCE